MAELKTSDPQTGGPISFTSAMAPSSGGKGWFFRMLRAYRVMNSHLTEDSCSLRMQRRHHECGLGCRVARMEKTSFEGRREASRLAAVITGYHR